MDNIITAIAVRLTTLQPLSYTALCGHLKDNLKGPLELECEYMSKQDVFTKQRVFLKQDVLSKQDVFLKQVHI